jgi:hypothetical protein
MRLRLVYDVYQMRKTAAGASDAPAASPKSRIIALR